MFGNAPRADNKYPLLFQRRKACAHKLAGRRGHVFAARMIGDARQVIARRRRRQRDVAHNAFNSRRNQG